MSVNGVKEEDEKPKPKIQHAATANNGGVKDEEEDKKPIIQHPIKPAAKKSSGVRRAVKPVVDSNSPPITVMVKGLSGNEVFFRVKPGVELKKLMVAYCENQSIERHGIRFIYDGRVVRSYHTPDELQMKDGDEILIMLEAMGGGHSGR